MHEDEQLARFSAECGGHVDLSTDTSPYTREDLKATADAMRDGAPLIYQGQFFDGRWQGRADFLRRIPVASALGDHAYEVLDTKLARQVKPHAGWSGVPFMKRITQLEPIAFGRVRRPAGAARRGSGRRSDRSRRAP